MEHGRYGITDIQTATDTANTAAATVTTIACHSRGCNMPSTIAPLATITPVAAISTSSNLIIIDDTHLNRQWSLGNINGTTIAA